MDRINRIKEKVKVKLRKIRRDCEEFLQTTRAEIRKPYNQKIFKLSFILGFVGNTIRLSIQNIRIREFLNVYGYRVFLHGYEVDPKKLTYKTLKKFDKVLKKTGDSYKAFDKTDLWR